MMDEKLWESPIMRIPLKRFTIHPLIAMAILGLGLYPEQVRPLISVAIEIARSHFDAYIRH
jgi:hypothetical protein